MNDDQAGATGRKHHKPLMLVDRSGTVALPTDYCTTVCGILPESNPASSGREYVGP